MMIIRPAQLADLDSMLQLAQQTGSGLTTLPDDKDLLEEKIEQSIQAFGNISNTPALEYYFFVLEDSETKKVVGTSAIAATVGLTEAFYTYRLGTVVHTSPELNVHNVIDTLYLGNDYTGSTEICTLFLHPDYRKDGNGQLLSRCRFLFMAMHVQRFAPKVIAEMRGISDEKGESPFWNALGCHFFTMNFSDADALSSEGKNQFIAELMPKYPIYLPLLPESARKVIGKVHPDTKPALKMLEKEGFKYQGYVDIFDAGPSIEVQIEEIKTIKKSFISSVTVVSKEAFSVKQSSQYMLANTFCTDFRACYGQGILLNEKLTINENLAKYLKVNDGDNLRLYPTGRK